MCLSSRNTVIVGLNKLWPESPSGRYSISKCHHLQCVGPKWPAHPSTEAAQKRLSVEKVPVWKMPPIIKIACLYTEINMHTEMQNLVFGEIWNSQVSVSCRSQGWWSTMNSFFPNTVFLCVATGILMSKSWHFCYLLYSTNWLMVCSCCVSIILSTSHKWQKTQAVPILIFRPGKFIDIMKFS